VEFIVKCVLPVAMWTLLAMVVAWLYAASLLNWVFFPLCLAIMGLSDSTSSLLIYLASFLTPA